MRYKDYIDWETVAKYQILSEDFIRENLDILDPELISSYQYLSEDFMEEMKDKLDWVRLTVGQKMSAQFIIDHIELLDLDLIHLAQDLTSDDELFIRFYQALNLKNFAKYQRLSDYLVEKFWTVFNNSDSRFIKNLSFHQRLSNELYEKYSISNFSFNDKYKRKDFLESNFEQTDENIFIGYMLTGRHQKNISSRIHLFEPGKVYETFPDYHNGEFGYIVFAHPYKIPETFANQLVWKVKFNIEDIAYYDNITKEKVCLGKIKTIEPVWR